jgi:hypothetical protein
MLTARNLLFAALAVLAIGLSLGAYTVYEGAATPDDVAFAAHVAADNLAADLEQACQYDAGARAQAIAGSASWAQPAPVIASNAVPVPLPSAFAAQANGNGASVKISLVGGTAQASLATKCRADGVPPGTTVQGH